MNNSKYFIPGYEDKKILLFTRRHGASFLDVLIIGTLLIFLPVAVLVIAGFLSKVMFSGIALNFIVISVSLYYMVMTTYAFIEWINFYYAILIVTETEVIEVTQIGLFDRKISEISILRIQDVSAEVRGVLQTFFNYGNVIVESAGEKTQTYIIRDVPRPVELANEILKLHNEQITRDEREGEVVIGEGDFRKNHYYSKRDDTKLPPVEEILEPDKKNEDNLFPPLSGQDQNSEDTEDTEGDISKDDLEQGGEVKF